MRRHTLHPITAGLATLLVEYLALWGDELELLSVLLATLIIGILLDGRGVFSNMIFTVIYAVIVGLEIVYVVATAFKRKELEEALWRAVDEEMDRTPGNSSNNNG